MSRFCYSGSDDPRPSPAALGVGRQLQAARLAQGLSLESVVTTLRIRREFIEALEAGAHDRLPTGPYARGFVRVYAASLGLDGDMLVARLPSSPPAATGPVAVDSVSNREHRFRLTSVAALAIVAIGLAWGAWFVGADGAGAWSGATVHGDLEMLVAEEGLPAAAPGGRELAELRLLAPESAIDAVSPHRAAAPLSASAAELRPENG